MPIEFRFYQERYNTDFEYYTGNESIYAKFAYSSLEDLKKHWNDLITGNDHWYEGETYSAWIGDEIVCGGALDPGDIVYIEQEYNRIVGGNSNDKH